MISLGMGSVADENAWKGALENLWIVHGDEGEGTTADLAKVAQRGTPAKPKFKRGLSIDRSGGSEGGQVGSSCAEFVPEISWSFTGQLHGTSFAENGPMEVFSTSIVHRCIGGHELVIDPM